MSEAMNRREFLSCKGLGEMLRKAAPLWGEPSGFVEGQSAEEIAAKSTETNKTGDEERLIMEGYLSSPLYSYALLSEMPWDMLTDEARRYGIQYEGRTKMEVVRELFIGSGGKEGELR